MVKVYQTITRCLTLLLLCASSLALAQSRTITGKVTSSDDGTGLPGVNVLEKGTTNGTVTDASGSYSISVQPGATIMFSFIGYKTQEVAVGGQNTLDMPLQTDVTALSEVVVVGYGEQQKKDLTGAVAVISSRDFNQGVMTSPQDLIMGKLAGVQVTPSSGAPGSAPTIRIRGGSSLSGNNDPLIVIDGFPMDNANVAGVPNALAMLNPNEIESQTVLKDASATAIFGSRASNGVIMITTKKGKEGKPQFSYNGSTSLSNPIKYLDVLSGDDYRNLATSLADQGIAGITTQSLSALGASNTNWQKEIYRAAFSHNHSVSASGSLKNFPYRISYGFTDQQGILKTTGIQRHTLNLNLNPSFLDNHLKLLLTAKGAVMNNNFGNPDAVGAAVSFDPTQPVRNGNAEWGGYYTWLGTDGNPNTIATANPVALLDQTDNQSNAKRLFGNLQAEYKFHFLPELKLTVNGGYDIIQSNGRNNAPVNSAFTYVTGKGKKIDYTAKNHTELLDVYFNYVKEFGEHKIDFTGGYSWQHFYRQNSNYSRNGDETNIVEPDILHKNENYLVSFFGRANYAFKGKYIVTATLRDDGSSRFSSKNRWGLFPAVGVTWNMKDESFLSSVEVLSDFRLRASYGITGQQDLGTSLNNSANYPYLSTYTASQANAQYQFGNTFYTTLRPGAYDANIKWESTKTFNVGLDFGILNDKLTGSLELYQRDTYDMLALVPIPLGSNFSNYLFTNVGKMQNKGVELTLRATPVSTANFTWNAGFNFTYNENKITKITLVDDPRYLGVNTKFIAGGVGNYVGNWNVGYPATAFYVYQQVYDANGKPVEGLYVDKTGKGGNVVGSDANRNHYKQSAPKFMMGINSRLNYKHLDFSFSGRINLGNYVYNNNLANRGYYSAMYNTSGFFSNVLSQINDTKFVNAQYVSDYYVQNASFFKMDNMTLGYSFDDLFNRKLKARISFTVQNAFTITKYKGIDPEVNGSVNLGDNTTNYGVDNNIYPRARVFLAGLNLTF